MPPADDLIRGSTDLLVLSVLADEAMYGYAISKRVVARSNGRIRITPGVLYPLLHQLEEQGLLLSNWDRSEGTGDGGGRKRKWYRLSAKGRRRLEQRAAAMRAYQTLIESFLPPLGKESAR